MIIHCNLRNVSINLSNCQCEDGDTLTASDLRGLEKK